MTAWNKCFNKGLRQHKTKKKKRDNKSFYRDQATKAQPGISNDAKRLKLPKIGGLDCAKRYPLQPHTIA
jgi:hypothetical protein